MENPRQTPPAFGATQRLDSTPYGAPSHGAARQNASAQPAAANGYGAPASAQISGFPPGPGQPGGVPSVQEGSLILGRYRALSEAGAGGFGTVQLAWDTRIQRRVAVKCMPLPAGLAGAYGDNDVLAALPASQIPGLEEARTAALLQHPNIVQVYDFEVHAGMAYLIMEYVDGMTLQELLRTVGDDMTLDMVTAVFEGVAHALEFAHQNQVLHLDIKPANILIDRQGQVKVVDFGLARLSDAWGYTTANGGTIGYMPPEQMWQEPLDARCDEWALASVLYEMVSGANPFLARDIPGAIQAIEQAEIVLPSLCMEGLSPEADDVIFYALDPDRYERYASVRDFDEELGAFLGDEALGRQQIQAALTTSLVDDGSDAASSESMWTSGFAALKPHFERLGGKVTTVSLRVWGLLTALAAAVAELPTFDMLGGWTSPLCEASLAGMLVVGFLVPRAGALVAVGLMALTLLLHGVYLPAVLLLAVGLVWWLGLGSSGNAAANCGMLPMVSGAVGLNQIAPLLCGFFLPVRDAVKSAAFAWFLAVILASLGGNSLLGWGVNLGTLNADTVQGNLVSLLTKPTTYAVLASWAVAAGVCSLLVKRDTRGTAVAGAGAGGAVLIVGAMAVTGVSSGFADWMPDANFLVPSIIAAILVGVLGWVYSPARPDAGDGSAR